MSWVDRLENITFTIKTGDGKEFKPLWKNGEKSKEFNVSKYEFINLDGSFVDRKKPQGNVFPLVFFFQGDDNIEQCNEFELSANDNRMWTVEHPFYGTIKGQPTNLKRDDKFYNVTQVTVDFWESIDGQFPNSEISIKDETRSKVDSLNAIASIFLVENSAPDTGDIDLVKSLNVLTGSKFKPDNDSFTSYNNVISKAVKSADNLVTDTQTAFNDAQEVINYPAKFVTSVISKANSYYQAYETFKESISNLYSKYNFESQGASVLAGICLSAVNPEENDYITRNDIEAVNKILIDIYEDYLETLDNNQVDIYDVENSWSPNIQIQSSLMDLVVFTSNSLFLLSFDARQERLYETEEDTNLILLAHRFIGLDSEDKNLEIFRKINNINNEELFKVRKGTTIKYFV